MTTVHLTKTPVDGKRPGDTFRRQGEDYTVVGIVRRAGRLTFVTESVHGREVWI